MIDFHSFKISEQKDFGSDRMTTFDVTIASGSNISVREVFFVVELSSKPKSFGVSIKSRYVILREVCFSV